MRLAAEDRLSRSKLELLNWINTFHPDKAGGNATGNLAVTVKYVLKELFKPMLHNRCSSKPNAQSTVLATRRRGGVQTDTMRLYGNSKENNFIHAFALTLSTYMKAKDKKHFGWDLLCLPQPCKIKSHRYLALVMHIISLTLL